MSFFRTCNNKLPFKLSEKIIEGAYGSIYKVTINNEIKILKKIKTDHYFDEEYLVSKFIKPNTNICKCIAKYETKKYKYLLFPYYSNGDLLDYLSNKSITEKIVKKFVFEMLLSIKNLNNIGYCHLDIKLENFLVDNDEKLVLTDLGSIKKLDEKNQNYLLPFENALGTPSYIPPEFLVYHYGNKSDIWSIGVCFYNMIMNDMLYNDILQYQYYNSFESCNKLDIDETKLSKKGKKLLNSMLIVNPNKRISLDDAINSQWFDNIREQYEDIYISEYEVLI